MSQIVETKVKEFKQMTNSEIEEYLNTRCYLTKSEMGLLVSEFIYYSDHEILKLILSSKKFKENKDCICEFGSPVVQTMLYAIQGVYTVDSASDKLKLNFKRSITSILLDDAFDLDWGLLDDESNNPLHVLLDLTEVMSYDEIESLAKRALEKKIRPMNKNGHGDSSFDFVAYGNYSEENKKTLLELLMNYNTNPIMKITSKAYEVEETVEVN